MTPEDAMACRSAAYAVARRWGLHGHDAEDVAQEIAARLWARRDSLRYIGGAATHAARCLLVDRKRRQRAVRRYQRLCEPKPAVEPVDDLTARDEALRALREAVDALPDDERQIIRATLDGRKPADIARDMGIARMTVNHRAFVARRRLRDTLSRMGV